MSGSNRVADLTKPQKQAGFPGPFLMFKISAPTDGTSGDLMPKGALCVNTRCSSGNDALYYNKGTFASPVWVAATGQS